VILSSPQFLFLGVSEVRALASGSERLSDRGKVAPHTERAHITTPRTPWCRRPERHLGRRSKEPGVPSRRAQNARSGLAALAPALHRTTPQSTPNRSTEPAICTPPGRRQVEEQ
jgi:hypothetical protein